MSFERHAFPTLFRARAGRKDMLGACRENDAVLRCGRGVALAQLGAIDAPGAVLHGRGADGKAHGESEDMLCRVGGVAMKNKDTPKKLQLNVQSIRNLSAGDLTKVVGGGPITYSRCWCD